METRSQGPFQGEGVAPGFAGPRTAGVILRPMKRQESSEGFSGPPSQLTGHGSAGVSAADFSFREEGYAKRTAAEQEPFVPDDGLGAMRGFVLVLGLYLVMGAMGLGGLMLWHWLR